MSACYFSLGDSYKISQSTNVAWRSSMGECICLQYHIKVYLIPPKTNVSWQMKVAMQENQEVFLRKFRFMKRYFNFWERMSISANCGARWTLVFPQSWNFWRAFEGFTFTWKVNKREIQQASLAGKLIPYKFYCLMTVSQVVFMGHLHL